MDNWQINDYIPDPNTGKDRWQIHKIFKGGMGVVYIVYDNEWHEAFAVKTYQDKLQSAQAQEQFKQEANIWINLDRHENIAWARFVQNIHSRLYLFLEYVPGGDLYSWIGTKRLDLKKTLLFAIQFCYGMEHALAKGIKAHRDIKPQNCLITEDGTLKITDFGLAKAFDVVDSKQAPRQLGYNSIITTRTGQVGGTLPYMAPEQFDDLKHVDVKADVYSFGIMLYEMICGHWPFVGNTYTEFSDKHQNAPVPDLLPFSNPQAASLEDIVKKCLAKNPSERYIDFSNLRRELGQLYEIIYAEKAPEPKKEENLNASNLSNKGLSLLNLKRYKEAIICFEDALGINPKFVNAWTNKGVILASMGRYREAISCHDHALEIDSKLAAIWSNKGFSLGHLGHYDEAIFCFDQALGIDTKYVKAWSNKSAVLVNLHRYEEAITCCEHALEFSPSNAEVWSNKGVALEKLRRYEEAISCYDHALEIDPKHADAWYNKGASLGYLGRHEEEISCYDEALEINSKDADALFNKGVALTKLGRYKEAITCYDRVLLIDPFAMDVSLAKAEAIEKLENV